MLLDTSGLLCLYHGSEPFHQEAVTSYKNARFRLTHSYILAEFVALATARHFPRIPSINYINDLSDNPDIEVIWIDESIHREAVALLIARPDKAYSLCDAVSFVLMRHWELTVALTTDKHFEQEGFQHLLV